MGGQRVLHVLGLDPGTHHTGYGCVRQGEGGPERVASGVVDAGRGPLADRLARLHAEVDRLIRRYHPDACAIEGVFHHRNARSALLLGHARGVCLVAAAAHGVPVVEYAPAAVKRAIAGNGAAAKEQVGAMVARVLRFTPGSRFDETDALALALCRLEAERPLRLFE